MVNEEETIKIHTDNENYKIFAKVKRYTILNTA